MTLAELENREPALAALLKELQEAYHVKTPDRARAFTARTFVPDGTVLIIGTESDEWFEGTEDVTKLFYWDWASWGKVDFGFATHGWIRCNGDAAQVASRGSCTMKLDSTEVFGDFLKQAEATLRDPDIGRADKVRGIIRRGVHAYTQCGYGDTYTWPLRFSAFAERTPGGWRFTHMHFSLPSPSLPFLRQEIHEASTGETHPFFRDIPRV